MIMTTWPAGIPTTPTHSTEAWTPRTTCPDTPLDSGAMCLWCRDVRVSRLRP